MGRARKWKAGRIARNDHPDADDGEAEGQHASDVCASKYDICNKQDNMLDVTSMTVVIECFTTSGAP